MEGNDDDDDEEEEEGLFAPMIHTFEARARLSLETRVYTHTHTREGVLSFFLSFFFRCVWVLLCAGGKNVCLVNRVIIGSKHFLPFF